MGFFWADGTNKCHGARAKPSTLAPLKLCKLCCYAATLYPAFTLLFVFMASSFPSWMGFSLFCSARHQSPFMGLVPAFSLVLVFMTSSFLRHLPGFSLFYRGEKFAAYAILCPAFTLLLVFMASSFRF